MSLKGTFPNFYHQFPLQLSVYELKTQQQQEKHKKKKYVY